MIGQLQLRKDGKSMMETDMNFSMDGLNELIESVTKIKEQSEKKANPDEKMQNFTEIIQGVANKYASKWIDREDLEQELWVRILELINDCGGVENTDESLVARIAYNKAVDIYRYCRRRYESKAEFIEGSEAEYDDSDFDYFEAMKSEKFLKGYELVLYKQVIDLFPIGSKERKYVVLKIINNGLLSKSDLNPWDKALVGIPEREDEESYIHMLGYTSHAPGSWTCKKRDMKASIIAFLNIKES